MTAPPVLILAGGTGGHVFPALAVADELRARGVPVVWMGTRRGLEAEIVPARGIRAELLSVRGLRGTGLVRLVTAPWVLSAALAAALRIVRRERPRAVLGMGGFAAGPGGLAAWLLRRPLVVHEQNAVAGLTNRVLARFARRVLCSFPGTFGDALGAVVVGNPVRREIASLPSPRERLAGRSGALRLLVLGGSQGALSLNRIVPAALSGLASDEAVAVRHQAGHRTLEEARQAYRDAGVDARVEAFIEDMAEAYGWADLVVGRAGALTVAELAAAGVGSVLVPYPHAVDDHQRRNAAWLVDVGAAVLLSPGSLSAGVLEDTLRPLLRDRRQILGMAEAARERARPDAASVVAEACLDVEAAA